MDSYGIVLGQFFFQKELGLFVNAKFLLSSAAEYTHKKTFWLKGQLVYFQQSAYQINIILS